VSLALAIVAVSVDAPSQTLEKFASLPADRFAPGPTSGQLIPPPPPNGRFPPFVDKQPIQGFSSVLRTSQGDLLAMPDRGFVVNIQGSSRVSGRMAGCPR
jgi:glycerophosphoryl diester phosphodiesterase